MTSVRAATDEAGEIEKERTLLRSTIAIAQAEDSNGQVTQSALQTLLNNRNTIATVAQETATTLKVIFSASARSYIVDINKGLVFSVAFDANGGTGAPTTQYATQGKATIISKTVPTREGYNFLGWALSSTATTAEYVPGTKFTPPSNTSLYAVWTNTRPMYTITFHANGGSFSDGTSIKTFSVKPGDKIIAPVWPNRSGYSATGWATTASTGGTVYPSVNSIIPTSDMTFYCQWSTSGGIAKKFDNMSIKILDTEQITTIGKLTRFGDKYKKIID